MSSKRQRSATAGIADRVKSVIEGKGLSLHAVSQATETIFGASSPQFLPHNFYYELNLGTFSPSLHQLFALSRITNYRLFDWLRVFGLDVEEIPRLQILLPTKRTILLESSLSDPNAWVKWFQNNTNQGTALAVAPLSQLLQVGATVRQSSLLNLNHSNFLYAKIGLEDALAFPDLVPGSIVRISPIMSSAIQAIDLRRIFLVEHSFGICCCRLLPGTGRKITLVSTQLPYAQVQLKLHHEARILGMVDLEIRPLAGVEQAIVPRQLAKRWRPEPLTAVPKLGSWLSSARAKAGASLREASKVSREIANLLNDDRYFVSASALSNCEAAGTVPKHFQKAMSLCLAYAVPFRVFLGTLGIPDESAGTEAIPDELIPRAKPHDQALDTREPEHEGFLGELMHQVEEVPLFLRHAIDDLSRLPSASLRTLFWVGGIRDSLHPYLANALLISVDRHKKLPVDTRSRPVWEQLSYIVLKRDGNYLVGPCGIEDGALLIHPDSEHLTSREEFRNHRDAEVIGQVRAVVRKL